VLATGRADDALQINMQACDQRYGHVLILAQNIAPVAHGAVFAGLNPVIRFTPAMGALAAAPAPPAGQMCDSGCG
jgi:hypothetical protein